MQRPLGHTHPALRHPSHDRRQKTNPAAGITWDSLDLSGAQLDHLRVFTGHFTNCCFDLSWLTDPGFPDRGGCD